MTSLTYAMMKIYFEKDNPEAALEGRQAVGTVYPTTSNKAPTDLYVDRTAWESLFVGCHPGEKVTIIIIPSHD